MAKGCLWSAGLPASLKPTSITMEEPESVKLFTASAITATLPESSPATSLIANSKKVEWQSQWRQPPSRSFPHLGVILSP